MAIISKGSAKDFLWGIPSGTVTVQGRITDIRISRTIDQEELQNGNGEVDGVVFLDKKHSAQIDIIVPINFNEVERASSLTVDNAIGFIVSVDRQWERRGFAKYTLNTNGWELIAETPAGGGS